MNKKSFRGFTLMEIMVYLAILIIASGSLIGILLSVLRINSKEGSNNEVTSQLNNVMRTINSLVKDSSSVEIASGTTTSVLKLRMKDPAVDPTCVSLSGGMVKLAQGPASGAQQNCTATTSDLTNSKVFVNNLTFNKLTFYPGHDEVVVDIQMSASTTNATAQASRALHSAFSRVSAATFDSNLIPGTTNSYDVGVAGNVWRTINATTKNFNIVHPSKPGYRLFHSTLEGPEHAVFYRGQAQLENGKATITLPDYFEALTRKENRTVLITNVDGFDNLAVQTQNGKQITDGKFFVVSNNGGSSQKFNWEVKAERSDVPPLEVEVQEKQN